MAFSVKSKKNGTEYYLHGGTPPTARPSFTFCQGSEKKDEKSRPERTARRLRGFRKLADRPAHPEKEKVDPFRILLLFAAASRCRLPSNGLTRQRFSISASSTFQETPMQHQIHGNDLADAGNDLAARRDGLQPDPSNGLDVGRHHDGHEHGRRGAQRA